MIRGKSGENLGGLKMVFDCGLLVAEVEHVFKEVGICHSIGNVVLAHLSLTNCNSVEYFFLKGLCFPRAELNLSLLFENRGQKCTIVMPIPP